MSIQGKKMAMVKHACSVANAAIENVQKNLSNPLLLQIGLIHIKAHAESTSFIIQSTPADRFNDDGSLKPEDMTGKVVVAAGGGNPAKVRVMLEDVFKDSGFKAEGL